MLYTENKKKKYLNELADHSKIYTGIKRDYFEERKKKKKLSNIT